MSSEQPPTIYRGADAQFDGAMALMGSTLHACLPSDEVHRRKIDLTRTFWVPLVSGPDRIGWVEFRFLAVISGQVLFEACGLRAALEPDPPTEATAWLLSTPHAREADR